MEAGDWLANLLSCDKHRNLFFVPQLLYCSTWLCFYLLHIQYIEMHCLNVFSIMAHSCDEIKQMTSNNRQPARIRVKVILLNRFQVIETLELGNCKHV